MYAPSKTVWACTGAMTITKITIGPSIRIALGWCFFMASRIDQVTFKDSDPMLVMVPSGFFTLMLSMYTFAPAFTFLSMSFCS